MRHNRVRGLNRTTSLVALILPALACAAEPAAAIDSVDALWRGIDVRAEPLVTTVVAEWGDAGLVTRKIMFTSHRREEVTVRILGFYSFPAEDGPYPGVLHIHGGGQTANREYTEYFARRGYAALSIDWAGNPLPNGGGHSDWGRHAVAQADNGQVFRVLPDPRENPWFHWAIACRRALTFLEQQPEVDPARLGVFGISMGGRLTWLVVGTDDRVRAAASVYGAVRMADPVASIERSEQVTFKAGDADLWRRTLDAVAYAPRIHAPFLYLSAANDFYGAMDFADETLESIPHPNRRQAFTPHFNRHVGAAQARDLELWFDRWLKQGPAWPETPELQLDTNGEDGVPRVTLAPDRRDEVTDVSIYYSIDPYPQSRFWRQAETSILSQGWQAALPIITSDRGLFVMANVGYRQGISLTSHLLTMTATDLRRRNFRATETRTLLIDDFIRGGADWFVPDVGVNPLLGQQSWFRRTNGPDGQTALQCEPLPGKTWRLATRKISDPRWQGQAHDGLGLYLRADETNTLLIVATENERRRPSITRVYVAAVTVDGGAWENIQVPRAAFHDARSGELLKAWTEVNILSLQGSVTLRGDATAALGQEVVGPWRGAPPVVARIEWIAGASEAR